MSKVTFAPQNKKLILKRNITDVINTVSELHDFFFCFFFFCLWFLLGIKRVSFVYHILLLLPLFAALNFMKSNRITNVAHV